MSMMQAAPAAAQSRSRQHVAPQQQQQQQVQQQQQQQQQVQRSQSSSHQFSCLYTHQKTQKRKKWQDGRFVVEFGRVGKLFDANPTPGSGNPCLAQVELSRPEATALLEGHQTNIEAEKFLIQLEGLWVDNHSSSSAQQSTAAGPSSKMQKLMKSKFRKPGKAGTFRPPNPQSQHVATSTAGTRRRPLQPGELVRQHYGGGLSGEASHSNTIGYNNNNNNNNNSNIQNQHPNHNNSSLPAWKTPASLVPVNPQTQPNGPRSPYNQQGRHQQQNHQPRYELGQQHASFTGRNAIGMRNGNRPFHNQPTDSNIQHHNTVSGNGSNWSRNSQLGSFSTSNSNTPYQKEGQGQAHGQNGDGNAYQPARQQQYKQSGLFPTPQQEASDPRPTTGQTQAGSHHSSHENLNPFQGDAEQDPPSNGTTPGPPMSQQQPQARQEFVQNGFDPSTFYGEDGDDDDESDDEDGGGGFALSSQGWYPSAAAIHPKQNDTMNPNKHGDHDDAKQMPGNSGSMGLHQGPATSTSHGKTLAHEPTARNEQQATMTNQDLLALFGGDDDDSLSQSQAEDEIGDGHDQYHATAGTGHQHLQGNKETTSSNKNSSSSSHQDLSLFKQPNALAARADTGINAPPNGTDHEFSLPPAESSSDSSDSDGD